MWGKKERGSDGGAEKGLGGRAGDVTLVSATDNPNPRGHVAANTRSFASFYPTSTVSLCLDELRYATD